MSSRYQDGEGGFFSALAWFGDFFLRLLGKGVQLAIVLGCVAAVLYAIGWTLSSGWHAAVR